MDFSHSQNNKEQGFGRVPGAKVVVVLPHTIFEIIGVCGVVGAKSFAALD